MVVDNITFDKKLWESLNVLLILLFKPIYSEYGDSVA